MGSGMLSRHRSRRLVSSVAFAVTVGTMTVGVGALPSGASTKTIPAHAKIIEGLVTAFTGAESFIGGVLSAAYIPPRNRSTPPGESSVTRWEWSRSTLEATPRTRFPW